MGWGGEEAEICEMGNPHLQLFIFFLFLYFHSNKDVHTLSSKSHHRWKYSNLNEF